VLLVTLDRLAQQDRLEQLEPVVEMARQEVQDGQALLEEQALQVILVNLV